MRALAFLGFLFFILPLLILAAGQFGLVQRSIASDLRIRGQVEAALAHAEQRQQPGRALAGRRLREHLRVD